MSGVELIGAISGIVAILDTVVKAYSAVRDAAGLPAAFHSAAERLPLVMQTLETARGGVKLGPGESASSFSEKNILRVLDSCEKKALALQRTFQLMAPKPGDSTPRRFTTALQSLGKGKKVDGLMEGIIADIQLLVGSQVLTAQTREKVADFEENVKMERGRIRIQHEIPVESPTERWGLMSITNSGAGSQNIHTGTGNQFINNAGAPQYHGTFTGPFHFISPVGAPSQSPSVTPRSTFYADRTRRRRGTESPPPWSP